jgi:calpain-15
MDRRQRARVATISIVGDDATRGPSDDAYQRAIRTIPPHGTYQDPEFPAVQLSIDGKEDSATKAPAPAPAPSPPGTTPRCRCGTPATAATVASETPNKGRAYFHCPKRNCGFFAWADGGASSSGGRGGLSAKPLEWTRLPSLVVVTDYGFRAADLRQGGVGDCWFLSALAVVAERHDLIARLFANGDTAPSAQGIYALRFFLDGEWTSVVIDDRLPVARDPRRPDLAFGCKLAFSRCGSTSQQMLWASLLEKGYAKAHGSYKAISGGEISEALLDLTGAPTLSVDFDDPKFDSEQLWRSMVPPPCAF